VGAVRDGLLNAEDVVAEDGRRPGAAAEALEVDQQVAVWVKQRRGSSGLQLTMLEPKLALGRLRPGAEVSGTVTSVGEDGSAFVDIGFVNDALLRRPAAGFGAEGGEDLAPGQAVTAWVRNVHRDGKVDLVTTLEEEEPAEQPAARRGIV